MTRNTKIKNYLEKHNRFENYPNPPATVEDYNNQRHRMHIIQAKNIRSKHAGSKPLKKLLQVW